MKAGDSVIWAGIKTTILLEFDSEFVYLATGETAQLVHVSELVTA